MGDEESRTTCETANHEGWGLECILRCNHLGTSSTELTKRLLSARLYVSNSDARCGPASDYECMAISVCIQSYKKASNR